MYEHVSGAASPHVDGGGVVGGDDGGGSDGGSIGGDGCDGGAGGTEGGKGGGHASLQLDTQMSLSIAPL